MKQFISSFIISALVMLVFDGIWLGVMMKRFYIPQLAHLASKTPQLAPAILFYVLYTIGVVLLIVTPALQYKYSYLQTFLYGMLLGMVAYGTYDLTNMATLKNWPVLITVVDIVWGAFLTGTVSLITVFLMKYIIHE